MDYLDELRELIEDRIEEVIDGVEQDELNEELEHVVLAGGKRVRPTITLLVCSAVGGDVEDALDFAVGVELIHNASLVVDDIIDESDLRRGTPSVWAEYGHDSALLASDGLVGEAFALLSQDTRAMQSVTEAMVELGEGEATELISMPSNEDEYMDLIRRKTAALFRASAELGVIAADTQAHSIEWFGQYGNHLGLAFQIRDDVLDATADPEKLGKPTRHDAMMDRPSVVEVTDLSVEEANERAREELAAAYDALDRVDAEDRRAMEYLEAIAEFVVVREY